MLQIKTFVFNYFSENTYVIWNEDSKEAAVIDPGCFSNEEKEELSKFIDSEKLTVKYLINTHCHLDHIFGNNFVKNKYQPEFLSPEKDLYLLKNLVGMAQVFNLRAEKSPLPDKYITDQTEIFLGSEKGTFLFTPGHSPGEYCIYFETADICFTGDVLFNESIGRTDLPGGDFDLLMNSINEKLLILPDKTMILPGHGQQSTIGREKEFNSFLL